MKTLQRIDSFENIYILGIGGSALCCIAQWYLWNGKKVFGYDKAKGKNTDLLEKIGASIHFDDKKESIPKTISNNIANSLIIYTPALANNLPDNSEIYTFLKNHDATIIKRSDFFSFLTSKYTTVAVAGTHGKTSTTAMLANIFHKSTIKTVSFVGGILNEYQTGFIYNCSTSDNYIIIIEADEYDRFFLHLDYNIAIITTSDSDHLDYYRTDEAFTEAFKQFASKAKTEGKSIYLHKEVDKKLQLQDINKYVYSLNDAEIRAENILVEKNTICFNYINDQLKSFLPVKMQLSGLQQVENSCPAISVALQLGVGPNEIVAAVEAYAGVDRRFSILPNSSNIVFIDDFAHHPVEISGLIRSVKKLYPHKRILAIFQPHTYTRTRDYLKGFANELSMVDKIILLPVYAARELDIYSINSKNIYDMLKIEEKLLAQSFTDIPKLLNQLKPFDIILTIGAGDIFAKSYNIIIDWLHQSKN